MKKLISYILLYLNYTAATALLLSYISIYINPLKMWVFPFFGLAYPYILIVNILFIFFWIILLKKNFLLSLITILIGWGLLIRTVQFKGKSVSDFTGEKVKVLSYNVRLFNHFQWINDTSICNNIVDFINTENPKIVCLQEYSSKSFGEHADTYILSRLKGITDYQTKYTSISSHQDFGIATFSSYPILNKGHLNFENSDNVCIYCDIKINEDTLRVYNAHLQSMRLDKSKGFSMDSLIRRMSSEQVENIKQISFRMRRAYKIRGEQAKIIAGHIKRSPYPVVVCGDFNDTPISYTYQKIKSKLKDSFVESGKGFGNTYYGAFPSFRIDYIFHSGIFLSSSYQTKKIILSDHFPIVCDILISEKK